MRICTRARRGYANEGVFVSNTVTVVDSGGKKSAKRAKLEPTPKQEKGRAIKVCANCSVLLQGSAFSLRFPSLWVGCLDMIRRYS